jgi:hypothetical protein
MRSVADEHEDLVAADRHILEAEQRALAQATRVRRHRDGGLDTQQSERLLKIMQETLELFRRHRAAIATEIERLERMYG